MNRLKLYSIIGIIFVIVTGTISHFVYEWSGNNVLLGFLTPVNESTWEHMKLLFFPMLLYSVFMNRRMKQDYPCVTTALYFGVLLGTFLIPVIFYTYSGILGRNIAFFDIATFIVSVILAFVAVYKLTLSCKLESCNLELLILIVASCFFIFTYFPPNIGIFTAPIEH